MSGVRKCDHCQSSIEYHENCIPAYVHDELDRLYGSRCSCLPYFLTYKGIEGVSTYVARSGESRTAIFLHRRTFHQAFVLNETVRLDPELIDEFATFMFDRFTGLEKISFRYVAIEKPRINKLWRAWDAERTDVVLPVPATVESYVEGLGGNTRHNIRRYMKRLTEDHPSFRVSVFEREQISESHLRALFSHSTRRLRDKIGMTREDEAEIARVWSMAKACGFVCVATIDDEICAGLIGYRFGENFSFRLVGHDLHYDKYSLGFLIYFMTICECIKLGGRTLNLGWGEYPYKSRLGGVARKLSHVDIYRSATLARLDLTATFGRRVAVIKQSIKQDIKRLANRDDGLSSRAAAAMVHLYRRRKAFLTALPRLLQPHQSSWPHQTRGDVQSSKKEGPN